MIMLAAGNSRRFGSNKLLYTVDGIPMYRHILEELLKVRRELEAGGTQCSLTVVTQYDQIAEAARREGALALYNLHPDEGISSSVRIGLGADRDADAWLFTVSDQPWLRGETILALVGLFQGERKGIACVEYGGKTGNPCIFSRKYFGELMELEGDVGGKRVIRKHREDTAVLEVPDGKELADMDVMPEVRR